jgi:hypothetical protein
MRTTTRAHAAAPPTEPYSAFARASRVTDAPVCPAAVSLRAQSDVLYPPMGTAAAQLYWSGRELLVRFSLARARKQTRVRCARAAR